MTCWKSKIFKFLCKRFLTSEPALQQIGLPKLRGTLWQQLRTAGASYGNHRRSFMRTESTWTSCASNRSLANESDRFDAMSGQACLQNSDRCRRNWIVAAGVCEHCRWCPRKFNRRNWCSGVLEVEDFCLASRSIFLFSSLLCNRTGFLKFIISYF